MIDKIKVSFDFDKTLGDSIDVQDYVEYLVNNDYDVYIVTRRFDSKDKYTDEMIKEWGISDINLEHNRLFEIANKIGVKPENIIFLNMEPKFNFFQKNKDFAFHLDDDLSECIEINDNSDVFTVHYSTTSGWKSMCNYFIRKKRDGE